MTETYTIDQYTKGRRKIAAERRNRVRASCRDIGHLWRTVRDGRKLTAEQVRDIRTSTDTQMTIARRHGISQPYVSEIRLGRFYRDVAPTTPEQIANAHYQARSASNAVETQNPLTDDVSARTGEISDAERRAA